MAKFYKIDDAIVLGGFGEAGEALVPNTTDAAKEKHVPAVEVDGSEVKVVVGSVAHPMGEEHYITFIALETTAGVQMAYLEPGDEPAATFVVAAGETPVAAYEYCNLHGLWKAEL